MHTPLIILFCALAVTARFAVEIRRHHTDFNGHRLAYKKSDSALSYYTYIRLCWFLVFAGAGVSLTTAIYLLINNYSR